MDITRLPTTNFRTLFPNGIPNTTKYLVITVKSGDTEKTVVRLGTDKYVFHKDILADFAQEVFGDRKVTSRTGVTINALGGGSIMISQKNVYWLYDFSGTYGFDPDKEATGKLLLADIGDDFKIDIEE